MHALNSILKRDVSSPKIYESQTSILKATKPYHALKIESLDYVIIFCLCLCNILIPFSVSSPHLSSLFFQILGFLFMCSTHIYLYIWMLLCK
jgi:hypothetical protein